MKRPDSFLTNTDTATGRAEGEAVNNPGDNSGTGIDQEIYNDPAYANIAVITSYKEDGLSDADETTVASDMRDALEEMTEKVVDGVDEWDSSTIFGIGDLVTLYGYQFVSFKASNQNNDPLATIGTYWYKCPKSDVLLDMFSSGEVFKGGLSPIADRAGSDYQQNLLVGNYRLGGAGETFYNFYMVRLDGTQVTGDATLVAIFDPGGSNEYWNIDMIAPDSGGTRTLLDMGDYVSAPQSSSGDADTLGELVEDQGQGHKHLESVGPNVTPANSNFATDYRNGQDVSGQALSYSSSTQTANNLSSQTTDGTNGTPRIGSTTHGKRFTEGPSYVIVAIPA